jgi:hypothetical protein
LKGNDGKPEGLCAERRVVLPSEQEPNVEHRTSQRRTLDDCEPQKEGSVMPIPWKAIQRKNPRDPNAAPKYYALDVTRSLLDEEDAAHAIAVRSGLSGSILDLRLSICD